MRENKFIGWDGKKMLLAQDLSQNGSYWEWLGKYDVVLLEYTGLKDKNRKDIYEGYIVSVQNGNQKKVYGEVVYVNGSCQFSLDLNDGTYYSLFYVFEIEILRNKYENPELLKGILYDKTVN